MPNKYSSTLSQMRYGTNQMQFLRQIKNAVPTPNQILFLCQIKCGSYAKIKCLTNKMRFLRQIKYGSYTKSNAVPTRRYPRSDSRQSSGIVVHQQGVFLDWCQLPPFVADGSTNKSNVVPNQMRFLKSNCDSYAKSMRFLRQIKCCSYHPISMR